MKFQKLLNRISKLAPIALMRWGETKAFVKTIEELAELQVELAKGIGHSHPLTQVDGFDKARREKVVDEIADVLIMAHRMRLMFGVELVDVRMAYKLYRLEKALRAYEAL